MLIHLEKYIWVICFIMIIFCITSCIKNNRRDILENYFEQYPENWSNSGE